MIIPHRHQADLSMAKPEHMFELEALLRATSSIWRKNASNIAMYMQKHAQSGMTVPHMHIHIIAPPDKKAFRKDILQQLRFLSSVMAGCVQEIRFLHKPSLSMLEMQKKIRRFSPALYQAFKRELSIQTQRFTRTHKLFALDSVSAKISPFKKK